jgi:hypothetical protein
MSLSSDSKINSISNWKQLSRTNKLDTEMIDFDARQEFKNSVELFNTSFPIALIILAILTNTLVFVVYQFKNVNPLLASYQKKSAILNLLCAFLMMPSFFKTKSGTYFSYSQYTCKSITYCIHVLSQLSNMLNSLMLLSMISHQSTSSDFVFNLNKPLFLLIILTLTTSNLIDLIYVEPVNINDNFICSIRNLKILAIRDLIDFILYFLLPFALLTMSSYIMVNKLNMSRKELSYIILNKRHYKMNLFKYLIGPVSFAFFNLPIFLITFINDAFIVYYSSSLPSTSSSSFTIPKPTFIIIHVFYLISFVLNQFNYIGLIFCNLLFNKNFFREFLDLIFINRSLINNNSNNNLEHN